MKTESSKTEMNLESYAASEPALENVENETQGLNTIKAIMKKYGISIDKLLQKRDIAGVGNPSGFLPECDEAGDFDKHISEQFREEIATLLLQNKYHVVCEKTWNKIATRRFLWCPACKSLLIDTFNMATKRAEEVE